MPYSNEETFERMFEFSSRDLDETYERVLCRIDTSFVSDVRRILTLLCFSKRPLTERELVHAYAIEIGAQDEVDQEGLEMYNLYDVCLGLITVFPGTKNKRTVHIGHYSVQEYLLSARISESKAAKFALESGACYSEIAGLCLTSLLEPRLCQELVGKHHALNFQFSRYSAEYWLDHYASCNDKRSVEGLTARLFDASNKSFDNWFKLYPSLRVSSDTISSRAFYASLLGLEEVLQTIILTAKKNGKSMRDLLDSREGRTYVTLPVPLSQHQGGKLHLQRYKPSEMTLSWYAYTTPLFVASCRGHLDIVRMLLDHGADLNKELVPWRMTALFGASYYEHIEIAKLLLDRGANRFASSNLKGASWWTHLDALSFLIKEIDGFLLSFSGEDLVTPLNESLSNGEPPCDRPTLINDLCHNSGIFGASPLLVASYCGNDKIVKLLLDHGADVNQIGGRFHCSLHEVEASTDSRSAARELADHELKELNDYPVAVKQFMAFELKPS